MPATWLASDGRPNQRSEEKLAGQDSGIPTSAGREQIRNESTVLGCAPVLRLVQLGNDREWKNEQSNRVLISSDFKEQATPVLPSEPLADRAARQREIFGLRAN
jgi:hypothetical protein